MMTSHDPGFTQEKIFLLNLSQQVLDTKSLSFTPNKKKVLKQCQLNYQGKKAEKKLLNIVLKKIWVKTLK